MAAATGGHRRPGGPNRRGRVDRSAHDGTDSTGIEGAARPPVAGRRPGPVMARSADATRTRLIDAASRLFAERGVNNVSLAEIVRAAEQKNASALHYHFGGREGLIEAVLERYIPVIRGRRLELLDDARSSPDDDLHSAVAALVRPVTELAQRGEHEREYLHIGAELATGPQRDHPKIQALFHGTAGGDVGKLVAGRLPQVPAPVFWERFRTVSLLNGRAASDRIRMLAGEGGADPTTLEDEAFVVNLIDMIVGALSAPVTAGRRPGPRRR